MNVQAFHNVCLKVEYSQKRSTKVDCSIEMDEFDEITQYKSRYKLRKVE